MSGKTFNLFNANNNIDEAQLELFQDYLAERASENEAKQAYIKETRSMIHEFNKHFN